MVPVLRAAAVVVISDQLMESPEPLPIAPAVEALRVIFPLLPRTMAVTVPLPRSPLAAVAATAPWPTLAAGMLKLIRLTVASLAYSDPRSEEHTSELQSP